MITIYGGDGGDKTCARMPGNSRRWGQLGRMQLRPLGPGFCGAQVMRIPHDLGLIEESADLRFNPSLKPPPLTSLTSVWPLPSPGRVERKGFCATWLLTRAPLGVAAACQHKWVWHAGCEPKVRAIRARRGAGEGS